MVDLLEQGKEPWIILREETQRQYTGKEDKEGKGKPSGLVASSLCGKGEEYIFVVFVKPCKAPRLVEHGLVTWGRNQGLNMSYRRNFNFTPFAIHLISISTPFSVTGNLIFH